MGFQEEFIKILFESKFKDPLGPLFSIYSRWKTLDLKVLNDLPKPTLSNLCFFPALLSSTDADLKAFFFFALIFHQFIQSLIVVCNLK